MHVEETIEARASLNTKPSENSLDNSANLPTLNQFLIDDMSQLFSIYPIEKALLMAKSNWPQFRFIHCSEYDMAEKEPFKVFNNFSFFLIGASLGCATLTYEPHKSVGLIVAEHEPD